MISKTDAIREAGFSLLEVVICVGLLLLGSAVALGVLPSLARASQQETIRSAATDIGRNTIERVRAAVAYYPTSGGIGDVANTADHAWAFVPASSSTSNVAAHLHRSFCGSPRAASDVPMSVTVTYDRGTDSIRTVVSYPPNPCDVTVQNTITLSAQLAPSAWYPQTLISTPITDPAQQ